MHVHVHLPAHRKELKRMKGGEKKKKIKKRKDNKMHSAHRMTAPERESERKAEAKVNTQDTSHQTEERHGAAYGKKQKGEKISPKDSS